jgi:hypothetical protein
LQSFHTWEGIVKEDVEERQESRSSHKGCAKYEEKRLRLKVDDPSSKKKKKKR